MLYFRHSELVKRYHISLKTVHNWIDAAKHGKLDLKLHKQGGRTYVVNSPGNITSLERLVEQGKKYRNSRYHKVVTPKPVFYELYSRRQILDIISNLNIHREIPRKYNYMDGGADNWDEYAQRLWEEEDPNLLKSTVELIRTNLGALDHLIGKHDRVNIVDVGVGNALPVRGLLEHLLEHKVLNRYIAIDISNSMLHIAKRNIEKWFGDKVKFEGYARDVSFEQFDDLLVDDMLSSYADQTVNLVLLFGGTPMNFRSPADMLRVAYGSMGPDDLIVYTVKPDSDTSRRFFNFSQQTPSALSPNHRFIFDLLDIDQKFYDVEMGYNEQKRMRYIRVRLKVALTVEFKFENGARSINFEKGDTIMLWRAWHLSAPEIVAEFERTGFALLQSSITKDREYLLTISGIDTKPGLE